MGGKKKLDWLYKKILLTKAGWQQRQSYLGANCRVSAEGNN